MPMLCMSLSFVKEEKNTVKMSLYSTQQGTLVIKENQVDFWEEGMVFGRQKKETEALQRRPFSELSNFQRKEL